MSTENGTEQQTASDPAVGSTRLVGQCVEVGDDEQGQARLIIHTTRDQIAALASNLIYAEVEITRHEPNAAPEPPAGRAINQAIQTTEGYN